MTENQTTKEPEPTAEEKEAAKETQEAPKGPLAKFVRKFFGRNKPEAKKSDPNIYPLY